MNTFEPCLVYPLNTVEPHWAFFHVDPSTQHLNITLRPLDKTKKQATPLVLSDALQHVVAYVPEKTLYAELSAQLPHPQSDEEQPKAISFEAKSPFICLIFNKSTLYSYPLQQVVSGHKNNERVYTLGCGRGQQYHPTTHQWTALAKADRPVPDTREPKGEHSKDLCYQNIAITLEAYFKIKALQKTLESVDISSFEASGRRDLNDQQTLDQAVLEQTSPSNTLNNEASQVTQTVEIQPLHSATGSNQFSSLLESPVQDDDQVDPANEVQQSPAVDGLGHMKAMIDETWHNECKLPLQQSTPFTPFNESISLLKSICQSKETYIAALIAILTNGKVILFEPQEPRITEIIGLIRLVYFQPQQEPETQKLYFGEKYSDFFEHTNVTLMGDLYVAFCETLLFELVIYRDTEEHVDAFFNHLDQAAILKNPPRILNGNCELIQRPHGELSLPAHIDAAYIVCTPLDTTTRNLYDSGIYYINRHTDQCDLLSTSSLDVIDLYAGLQPKHPHQATQSLMDSDLEWIKKRFEHTHQKDPILTKKLSHLIKTFQREKEQHYCNPPPNTPAEPLSPEDAAELSQRQDLSSLVERLNEQTFEQKLCKTKERMRSLGRLGNTVLEQIQRLEHGVHSHWFFWLYWQGSLEKLTAIVDEVIKLDLRSEAELSDALISDPAHPPNSGLYEALNRHRLWSLGRTMTHSLEAVQHVLVDVLSPKSS